MSAHADRPNVIPWPPIILAAALVVGIALTIFYPLPWASGAARDILQGVGVLLAMAATALYVTAMREMSRAGTAILPHREASHLVTSGPFTLTRNPIYLGNLVLLTALGLVLGSLWMFVVAVFAAYAEQKLGIEREEAHLEHRFGKAWRDYKKKVRRWI